MSQESGFRVLLTLAATVVVITGLKHSEAFFVPIMLALFIATISYPITDWLRNHKVPRFLAVLLTVLVDFAFLVGILSIAISLLGDFEAKWDQTYYPLLREKIDETSATLVATLTKFRVENAQEGVEIYFRELWKEQLDNLQVEKVLTLGTGLVGRLATFLGTTFVVLILTIFMLTEARQFGRRFNAICEARGPNFERMLAAGKDVQRFLGIKTFASLATGVLAGVLCRVCDLDFFILWGILAFTLNYIPVVGSIIAGIPPIILAILVHDLPRGVIVAVGYLSINTFIGNFVEPSMLGRRFGLSTLVVIVSVLFWGWLWGPVGMLLAVPMTMIIKVALDHSYEFHWLAVAVTPEKENKQEKAPKPKKKSMDSTDEKIIDEGLESLNLGSTELGKVDAP